MADRKVQSADREALKRLIRETIDAAGPLDPAAIPSKVRERIKARVAGDIDLEAYIAEILRERAKNP